MPHLAEREPQAEDASLLWMQQRRQGLELSIWVLGAGQSFHGRKGICMEAVLCAIQSARRAGWKKRFEHKPHPGCVSGTED